MKAIKVTLAAAALSCLLTACGGGGTSAGDPGVLLQPHPEASSTGPLAALAVPSPRLASAVRTPDASSFFNWAEATYASLFEAPQANKSIDVWTYRYYPKTDIYLGVNTSGDVLGLVGKGAGAYDAVQLGKIAAFGCSVYPSDCAPATPSGSITYNECVDPAAATLPSGFNMSLAYSLVSRGEVTGEQTEESTIEGPATFEGQSAIKTTTRTKTTHFASAAGAASTFSTSDFSYDQVLSNGLITSLGSETETKSGDFIFDGRIIPGSTTKIKLVYSTDENWKAFTLKVGESVTIDSRGTNTVIAASGPGSTTSFNYSTTHTYVARETVAVNGRIFDTCKYTTKGGEESFTSNAWLLVGKGIAVKAEVVGSEGGQQILLRSGTYNGAAL